MMTPRLRCWRLLSGAGGAVILMLSACTQAGGTPDGTSQAADLLVELIPESDTSSGIMKISDPQGDLQVIAAGDRDENGNVTVTTLSGQTAEAISFSAFLQNGAVTRANVAGHDLLVEPVEEGVVKLSLELAERTSQAVSYFDLTFDQRQNANWVVINGKINACHNDCGKEVERNLQVLMALVSLQGVVNAAFNEGCIESDRVPGQQCFDLLAVVDALGKVLNAFVASNASDLPSDLGFLCFDLAGECAAGTGNDNGTLDGGDQNDGTDGNDNQEQDSGVAVSLDGCWSIVLPANESTLFLERNEIWEFSNEQLIRIWKPQTTQTLEIVRFNQPNASGSSVSNATQSTTIGADETQWTLVFGYTIGTGSSQIDRSLAIDDGAITNGNVLDGTYQEESVFLSLEGSGGFVNVSPSGSFAGAQIDCPNADAENVLTQEEFLEKTALIGL